MNRWLAYIYERFPPLIYGSLALGIALSGSYLYGSNAPFPSTLAAFIGIWLFLFTMRLSNDFNDYETDKIAYPERPLPSGTIQMAEAKNLLLLLHLILFAFSELLWVALQGTSALSFLVLACWSWCAHYRFSLKRFWQKFPLISAVFWPFCVLPLAFFSVSVAYPLKIFAVKSCAYAAALYGSMLTYSLCRHLSPHLHPITASFIHYYGYRRTFVVATVGLMISGLAASFLEVKLLLWPLELIVLISLAFQFSQPENYRVPDMAASVSLVVHSWSGIF